MTDRQGPGPWNNRYVCSSKSQYLPNSEGAMYRTHTCLVDEEGKAVFHYAMPGVGLVCPGSGEKVLDYVQDV